MASNSEAELYYSVFQLSPILIKVLEQVCKAVLTDIFLIT